MKPLFLKPWRTDLNKTFVKIKKKYPNLHNIYYFVFPKISMGFLTDPINDCLYKNVLN